MVLQPAKDILVRRIEKRFELVECHVIHRGQLLGRKGSEDQIDLLEAAPLGPEQ